LDLTSTARIILLEGSTMYRPVQLGKNSGAQPTSIHHSIIEGSLEVKLPTIWRDEKQSREEA
jgi:hypothetical protein